MLIGIRNYFFRADAGGAGDDTVSRDQIITRRCAYLLFAAYAVVGTFGRFPWKADEPYSFSIVWNILTHGHWLVPHVGGDPFLEKPPLMFWLGALCARLFPCLPPHESSRLAVVLCLGLMLWAFRRAADRLYAETRYARRWFGDGAPSRRQWRLTAVCLLVGTLGLAEHGHKFTADLGQMAGAALALCALILACPRPSGRRGAAGSLPPVGGEQCALRYGLLFGLGTGTAFLAKGLLVPGIAGITLALCLALLPGFYQHMGRRFFIGALTAALPFALPWPWALYHGAPALFNEWLWVNNIGRFVGSTTLGGHDNPFQHRIRAVMLGGAPASFIVLAGLGGGLLQAVGGYIGRSVRGPLGRIAAGPCLQLPGWRLGNVASWPAPAARPAYCVTAVFTAVGLVTLCASGSMRDIYLLPLYPSLALLALPMAAMNEHRGGMAARIARRVLDGLFCAMLAIIAITWAQLAGWGDPALLRALWPQIGQQLPLPFALRAEPVAVMAAFGLIGLWLRIALIHRGGVLLSWTCGLSMVWGVAFLLLMPWLDAARSYKDTFTPLRQWLAYEGCLATDGLGESELSMLHYVTGRAGVRQYAGYSGEGDGVTKNPAARDCALLLVQDSRSRPDRTPGQRWLPVWRGNRPADDNGFTLYHLSSAGKNATQSVQ